MGQPPGCLVSYYHATYMWWLCLLCAKTPSYVYQEKMEAHCGHKFAHRAMMQLVAPDCTRSIPPHLAHFLVPTLRAQRPRSVPMPAALPVVASTAAPQVEPAPELDAEDAASKVGCL